MPTRFHIPFLLLFAALGGAPAAHAQWVQTSGRSTLTVEGYANVTTATPIDGGGDSRHADLRADLALRVLERIALSDGPDLGVRLVAESTPEDRLKLAEASVLLFGARGRLEIGERQGLPDVLTGYAPNNFSFTGAEYGPASGPSLDPGGGLQHAFMPVALAAQLDELGALGAGASLAGDRSTKIVYVSPKSHGYLAGLSFSPDADDARFGALAQGGVVHERYWDSNILRLGGSVSFARARPHGDAVADDLHSLNVGATLILDDDLMLGVSGTWNGVHQGRGVTASINYNRGRWTTGGYLQWAASPGDPTLAGDDRLAAAQAGISYRVSTRFRFYAAWYHFDFTDEGGHGVFGRDSRNQFLLGARAAL